MAPCKVPLLCRMVQLLWDSLYGFDRRLVPLNNKKKRTHKSTHLVISKLQPFRRSRALFRMMPLSLPRYTFLSEFMGAVRAGRPVGDSSSFFFPRRKNKVTKKREKKERKWSGGARKGGRREEKKAFRKKRRGKKNPLTLDPPQRSKESDLADFFFLSPLLSSPLLSSQARQKAAVSWSGLKAHGVGVGGISMRPCGSRLELLGWWWWCC